MIHRVDLRELVVVSSLVMNVSCVCGGTCRDDFTPANQMNRQHKDIYDDVIDTINKNCHRINQVGFPF